MINLSMITVTAIVVGIYFEKTMHINIHKNNEPKNNMYIFLQTVMKIDQPSESIRFLAFTIGVIFHIFFSCFMGQKLIDESSIIFHAVLVKFLSLQISI